MWQAVLCEPMVILADEPSICSELLVGRVKPLLEEFNANYDDQCFLCCGLHTAGKIYRSFMYTYVYLQHNMQIPYSGDFRPYLTLQSDFFTNVDEGVSPQLDAP